MELNGWLASHFVCRALEESQQLEVEKALVLTNQGSVTSRPEKTFTRGQVVSADLSQNVVAVCSVLLPRVLPRPTEQVFTPHLLTYSIFCCQHLLSLCVESTRSHILADEPKRFGVGGFNLPQPEKAGSGSGLSQARVTGGSNWLWQNLSGPVSGRRHRTR